jgi:DNA-binding response OmpR family regulator
MRDTEPTKLITIVEDDPDVAKIIEQVLADFGFRTAWCRSGGDLLRRLRTLAPDLCIIDLGLPDMDGIEAMQRVRAQSGCGILILTGRAHVSDRVMGLELGADDYVLKPFEPRELVARVRSILRRSEGHETSARQIAEFAGWHFNLGNNTLTGPGGDEHALSTAETELLKVFVSNPNRILQREKLMGTRDLAPNDRAIDVRISRLRRKLEPDPQSPAFIKTVYGAGYLFLATVNWSGGANPEIERRKKP